ncbi:MAG: hypothetical protein JXR70_13855 [Spirochaetales bacterium]|nr:hypothetical protein [Spirochaetales bacterium]
MQKSLGPEGLPVSIPHHLHFAWFGKYFHQFINDQKSELFWQDLIFTNRLRAILFSGIGVFFLFLLIFDISKKYFWSFCGSFLIIFSYGFFHYSAMVDTGIYPVVGTILTLWLFNKLMSTNNINLFTAIFSGVVLFMNIMFHQYLAVINVFFILLFFVRLPVFSLSFFKSFIFYKKAKINGNKKFTFLNLFKSLKLCIVMLLVACSLIILAYVYVGKSIYRLPFEGEVSQENSNKHFFSNISFQKWLFLYENYSNWGNGIKTYDPRKVFTGFTNAFLAPPFQTTRRLRGIDLRYNFKDFFNRKYLIYNVFAIMTLFVFIMLVVLLPALYKRFGSMFLLILFSFIALSILFTYWEPEYFEFWLVPVHLFCFLFLMIAIFLCEKISIVLNKYAEAIFSFSIFCLLIIFTLHNWTEYVIPYSSAKQIEEIDPGWNLDYCKSLFSSGIYKHPELPYGNLYQTDYYPKKEIYLPQWASGFEGP